MSLHRSDATTGFICKLEDQPDGRCFDYRVRFVCHPPFCSQTSECSTRGFFWYAKCIKCIHSFEIEYTYNVPMGKFVLDSSKCCSEIYINWQGHDIEQEMGSLHLTTVCWSRWFDRDNPSGTGDWETLSNLRTEYPGAICDEPLYIEAVTVDTMTPALATGQNIFMWVQLSKGQASEFQEQ